MSENIRPFKSGSIASALPNLVTNIDGDFGITGSITRRFDKTKRSAQLPRLNSAPISDVLAKDYASPHVSSISMSKGDYCYKTLVLS